MSKEQKNKLHKNLGSIDVDCSLQQNIDSFQDLIKKYGKDGFFDLYIEGEEVHDYGGSYHTIILYGYRLETDEEFNKRIAINKKQKISAKKAAATRKKKKEAKDIEEYERLCKKFEGKTK